MGGLGERVGQIDELQHLRAAELRVLNSLDIQGSFVRWRRRIDCVIA